MTVPPGRVDDVAQTTRLFDAQAGFGGSVAGERSFVTAEEWVAEMSRLDISGALVRTAPSGLDQDVPASNEALYEACDTYRALVPCPAILPNGAGDLRPEEEQVENAIARGAGAACLRPKKDGWILREWGCEQLLKALEERRLPAFCLESEVPLEDLADLARGHPRLPVILAEVGYRSQRALVPLSDSFPNVHLAVGSNYAVHTGIEQIARTVGPERLLFGTGFPEAEPMMAVTMLTYAELSDEEKALVGSGNMERVLKGIVR